MEQLHQKVAAAKESVSAALRDHVRPVVMSSFGKDSMVMLHLLKTMGLKFPVIFHREPHYPTKYEFANQSFCKSSFRCTIIRQRSCRW